MPADPESIEAHARTLGADAEALDGCATRLRELAARLREDDTVPSWLFDALNAHITACVVASADLAEAAERLRAYAALAAEGGRKRLRPPRAPRGPADE